MVKSISLSTIWRHGRFETLKEFFETAAALGFEHYELDASISLGEIYDSSLPDGHIPSLQIPCPAHPKNYDAQFSSLDRYEREAAREAAQSSLDLAYDLQTEVILVNLGQVDLNPQLERTLRQTWQTGGSETEDFADLQKELIALRARRAAAHLKVALYDIEYLATQASQYNLKLGLLTPIAYTGFGLPEELYIILNEFGPPVYYWHNTGWAQILDRLQLVSQTSWLDICAAYVIGVHLHDTLGFKDKQPPQPQGLDLAHLSQNLPSDCLLTCYFSAEHEPEIIQAGLKQIQEQLAVSS